MRIGPFDVTLRKRATVVPGSRGRDGWTTIWSSNWNNGLGWQQDVEPVAPDRVAAQSTVFSCTTLIASTIAMLRLRLVAYNTETGIWTEGPNPAYSPVLRKPNHFQTRQQFIEDWILSKLTRGNTYVLKVRDKRRVVKALHVLCPTLVTPHVSSTSGAIFYRIGADHLVGEETNIFDADREAGGWFVPASEIIHDRWNCLFHPLVGLSPIFACGLAATQALKIQQSSANFFNNQSRPSGVITAPADISDPTAERLKREWETSYGGKNAGRVAVLSHGLKFERMGMSPEEAQMVDQLKLSDQMICATFHVPAYMAGAAPPPAQANIEALNLEFYVRCLQGLIEAVEACLDEGLGLVEPMGTEFDLAGLLRMDTAAQTKAAADLVGAGIASPNEARRRFNLPPVAGGDEPFLQMQNWSLRDLSERSKPPTDSAETPAEKEARELMQRTMSAMERAASGLQRHANVSETRLARYRTREVEVDSGASKGDPRDGYRTKDMTANGGGHTE